MVLLQGALWVFLFLLLLMALLLPLPTNKQSRTTSDLFSCINSIAEENYIRVFDCV